MKHPKGMALVEIVVSMLMLAVAALAVTSTMSLVSSDKMRSAGGGSMDLQAANYARDTLEALKNNVSTVAANAAPLLINVASYDTTSVVPAGYTGSALPAAFTDAPISGVRRYTVSAGPAGTDLKKVTVCVAWAPDTCV